MIVSIPDLCPRSFFDYVSMYQACNDMFNIKKIVKIFPLQELGQSMIWLCYIKQLIVQVLVTLGVLVKYHNICGHILTLQSETINGYMWLWYYIRQLDNVSIYQTYNVMFNIKKFVKKIPTSRTGTIDGLLCTWLCYIKQFDCARFRLVTTGVLCKISIYLWTYSTTWSGTIDGNLCMMILQKATGLLKYLSAL